MRKVKPNWKYPQVGKLFKDSDKDGVPNVFDCKPYNKKKQDVISPMGGSNPYQDMINRQEYARQNAAFKRAFQQQPIQVIDRTQTFFDVEQPVSYPSYTYNIYSGSLGSSSRGSSGSISRSSSGSIKTSTSKTTQPIVYTPKASPTPILSTKTSVSAAPKRSGSTIGNIVKAATTGIGGAITKAITGRRK